jgi:putative Mn2+ efflux pump MntP
MLEVLLLAFALSMDAFAVSIGLGVKTQSFDKKFALKVGLFFGLFQALMPLVGHLASIGLGSFITEIDHWVAFVLLADSAKSGKIGLLRQKGFVSDF